MAKEEEAADVYGGESQEPDIGDLHSFICKLKNSYEFRNGAWY